MKLKLDGLLEKLNKLGLGAKTKAGIQGQATKYMTELRNPDTYRRGAITGILQKLNPTKNDRVNRTLLDLDDLAQNGNNKISRRFFLEKTGTRLFDRQKPFMNTLEHTPMEQIKDVIDRTIENPIINALDDVADVTKAPPKPPPGKTNLSRCFTYFVDI